MEGAQGTVGPLASLSSLQQGSLHRAPQHLQPGPLDAAHGRPTQLAWEGAAGGLEWAQILACPPAPTPVALGPSGQLGCVQAGKAA